MDRLTPQTIENRISEFITSHSGFEECRDYLSISRLSDCPRKVVREYRHGYAVDEHTHRMAYAGYEMEHGLRAMLTALEIIDPKAVGMEVVAPFDDRLRGHLDALSITGAIIELKSASRTQFERVSEKNRAAWRHFMQVQLYMRYSGRLKAYIVYRCRETYEHRVLEIPYHEKQADVFEGRARMILAAIDSQTVLPCECGKCGEA